LLVGVGRATLVDDSGGVQMLQLKLGALELRDRTPRLADFGFTSYPPAGSDAALLFVGGDRSNGVVIATGNQTYRLKGLASGDAAIYDSRGQSVWLTPQGIVVNGAGLPLTVNNTPTVTVNAATQINLETPKVSCSGDLDVAGNIVAQGDVSDHGNKTMAGMRTVFNGHDHTDAQGGSTGGPNSSM
jgi:phage baseplate assembly protein V